MVNQTSSGFTHELVLAEELVARGENAYLGSSEVQKRLMLSRAKHRDRVAAESLSWLEKLKGLAGVSVGLLPVATGEVLFTEKSANGGEVYDILYDSYGKSIKLSAKTSSVEDKAFRFSTIGYEFDFARSVLLEIFTEDCVKQGLSYFDALLKKDLTVLNLQECLVGRLASLINSDDPGSDKDRLTLTSLIKDRFIGSGGFYKTLPDGSVTLYPKKESTDIVELVPGSARTERSTCTFSARMLSSSGELKQQYLISFRVKFKDGVKKPVSFSKNGMPKNIAATVKVLMV